MEMLVQRIETILTTEPIDIYVNPTYLPEIIAADCEKLWTEERMRRVIEAVAMSPLSTRAPCVLRDGTQSRSITVNRAAAVRRSRP